MFRSMSAGKYLDTMRQLKYHNLMKIKGLGGGLKAFQDERVLW